MIWSDVRSTREIPTKVDIIVPRSLYATYIVERLRSFFIIVATASIIPFTDGSSVTHLWSES